MNSETLVIKYITKKHTIIEHMHTSVPTNVIGTFAHNDTFDVGLTLCAVVVAYHPDAEFKQRLQRIKRICDDIVVVDNSAELVSQHPTQQNEFWQDDVDLIQNTRNVGIAAALNQGISHAGKKGYEWFIMFDQDTIITLELGNTLRQIVSDAHDTLAIIGCNYWNTHKNSLRYQCNKNNLSYAESKTVITSGMLIHADLIDRIGPFREDYFIDSVDHEFCLRARKMGHKVYHSCAPLMQHSIGKQPAQKRWAPVVAFDHAPTRKYYMARNTLVTISIYWRSEPLWASKQIFRLIAELLSILLFETQKYDKLRATWVGIKHALQGKMGAIKSSHSDH